MTKKESNLWGGSPTTENNTIALETTGSKKPTWSTSRRIRWGLLDPLVALGLTIATQLVLSVAFIFFYITQNAQQINELDADALEASLLDAALSGPFILLSNFAMYGAWWFAIRMARKKGMKSYAKDFWLKFNLPRDIFIGLAFAIVFRLAEQGIMWLLGASGVNMEGSDNASVITDMSGIWFVLTAFVMAGIIGPFMEEFLFRGLVLQVFLRTLQHPRLRWAARNRGNGGSAFAATMFKWRVWISVLLSSAIFGFMHFQGTETFGQWFVIIWTGTLGVALAILTLRYKSLGPAIFAHIFFNLSGVILATLAAS